MQASLATEKIVSRLEKLLHKGKGKISYADATAETGFSIDEVKNGLARLIELYQCRVTMDENSGQLVFIFKYPLFKQGSKTFKELWSDFLTALWRGFQIVYKAAIGVILILYTIIFVLILLAVVVAGQSGNKNRSSGSGDVGRLIGAVFQAIFEGLRFATYAHVATQYATDNRGMRYKVYKPEKNKGKSFIQSVYSFVFGPEIPKYCPLEDKKEAVAFIRQNKGKITAADIIALTGVNYEEAESRLARYAVKFNGDLYITEDGAVVAEFVDLLQQVNPALDGGKIEYYVNEVEAPYQISGNSTGRNIAVSLMNAFNLFMSFVIINSLAWDNMFYFDPDPVILFMQIGLGWFPFVFSLLFFIIPLARIPYVHKKNNQREVNIIRKQLVGIIVETHNVSFTKEMLLDYAKVEKNKFGLADKVLEKLVIDMQGEINLNDAGKAVYTFYRLSNELELSRK